jgi:large subunit ribosomal protein L18
MTKVQKRRRREAKTDYLKRLKLLKSEKPRLVFRRTNKYVISQYIVSDEAHDKVVFGYTSIELLKHGWDKSALSGLKNLTASYFLGYLMGKTIQSKKLPQPILDFGMLQSLHKSRVYAFLEGIIDSGIPINCKEEAFPEPERIKGEHLKNKVDFEKIKSSIDKIK